MSGGAGKSLRRGGLALALVLVGLPVALFFGFRAYCGLIDAGGLYRIPSGSMEPTLRSGDMFYALPHTDDSVPPRGSVIVYRNLTQDGVEWVKRVIALPGERIAFKDGIPVIDGVPAEHTDSQVVKIAGNTSGPVPCPPGIERSGDACLVQSHRETLGGASYRVIDLVASRSDNTAEVTVPAGHVFVAGDNRDNSVDSRLAHHGVVPVTAITGIAWRYQLSNDADGTLDLARTWSRVE